MFLLRMVSPQQKQAAVGDLKKQDWSRRTFCTLVKVERKEFLKYNVNCNKLYRFNNTGNRSKLVPHDAKGDLCIPIKTQAS